jgi:hypothetical protein
MKLYNRMIVKYMENIAKELGNIKKHYNALYLMDIDKSKIMKWSHLEARKVWKNLSLNIRKDHSNNYLYPVLPFCLKTDSVCIICDYAMNRVGMFDNYTTTRAECPAEGSPFKKINVKLPYETYIKAWVNAQQLSKRKKYNVMLVQFMFAKRDKLISMIGDIAKDYFTTEDVFDIMSWDGITAYLVWKWITSAVRKDSVKGITGDACPFCIYYTNMIVSFNRGCIKCGYAGRRGMSCKDPNSNYIHIILELNNIHTTISTVDYIHIIDKIETGEQR